jgi:hypothetical protein
VPAQEALHYEFRTPDVIDTNNPYIGDPRPEHDQAWSDLTQSKLTALLFSYTQSFTMANPTLSARFYYPSFRGGNDQDEQDFTSLEGWFRLHRRTGSIP